MAEEAHNGSSAGDDAEPSTVQPQPPPPPPPQPRQPPTSNPTQYVQADIEQHTVPNVQAGPSSATQNYPNLPHLEGPLVDSEENSRDVSDTDSALGEVRSSRSESLASSVYNYRNENGRRYHAYRDGFEYNLPNDEQELDRLDLQHQLFYMTLNGSLHRSPLDQLPNGIQNVLDVGTGTGIWAIDFADKYSSAKVVGTDLSPIQPVYVPPNCHFYVDDMTAEWTFDEPFDYIHGRMVVVAIKDWPRFFAQAYEALVPGGWIEIQDLNFPIRCDDGSASPESAVLTWSAKMLEGAQKVGIDLGATNEIPRWMSEAGFVDVHAERYAWPINRWAKDRREKEKGLWMLQNVEEGVQGFSMGLFTRGLGWRPEEVEVFLAEVRKDFHDRKKHVYLPIGVFYARKPS